jgi:excisionase family DNA binding protein
MNSEPVEIVIRLQIQLPPGMSLIATPVPDEPLTCSVAAAAAKLGIGKSKVAELIARGDIESIKIDNARRIPHTAIAAYVQRLAEGGGDAPAA